MSNPIQFWLKDSNNKYLRLPVNPAEIVLTSPFGVNRVDVEGLGEISIPGFRQLKGVSFESFFPKDYNPVYCEYSGFPSPKEWVRQIEAWRDTRKNIRLIITGTDISIPVWIEEFDQRPERAGRIGDIYYNLSFVEFRAPTIRKVENRNNKTVVAANKRPVETSKQPKTYTVVKGDSLWAIAKRIYGNGARLEEIYTANKKVIGPNKNYILPGQKLVIP